MNLEKTAPLISVVVPVYKVELYLERCIRSITAQTYRNLEILLVDDGSPDQCGRICDAWADKDARITALHKTNGGLSDARNYGTVRSHGEYVTYVDSDDYVSPNYVSYLYELILKYQADISCCYNIRTGDDDIFMDGDIHFDWTEKLHSGREACAAMLGNENAQMFSAWGKLYRTAIVRAFPFPKGHIHEDEATVFKYYFHSEKVAVGNRILYAYFQNPDGIMGRISKKELNKEAVWALTYRAEYLEEMKDAELAKMARKVLARYYLDSAVNHAGRDDAYVKRYFRERRPPFTMWLRLGLWLYCRPLFMSCRSGALRRLWNCARTLKNRIFGFFRHIRRFRSYDENAVFLVGVPEYGNLGDHAIALAQAAYFGKLFPKAELVPITESQWEEQFWPLIACTRKYGNLCLLIGGGNMGELYPGPELIRLKSMRHLRKAQLVTFPQSVDYTERSPSLKRVRRIYESCPRLTLFLRHRSSYEKAKRFFPKCDCRLAPDIVMTLDPDIRVERRNLALFCVREDSERADLKCLPVVEKTCSKRGLQVWHIDNAGEQFAIPFDKQEEQLRRQWKLFASARLVVTNRLHGMIFACITRTPCLVFDNSTGKVLDYYHTWMEDSGILELNDSLSEKEALQRLETALAREELPSPARYWPLFDELEAVLRTAMEETRHEP